MNRDTLKLIIVKEVTEAQGCKATELVGRLAERSDAKEIFSFVEAADLIGICDELVTDGRLLEVEYVLPQFDYKIKSFFLPPETKAFISRRSWE